LRVDESEEVAGLDISSHGMYGYPESFIPPEEYPGGPEGTGLPAPARSSAPVGAAAITADPAPGRPTI
jgi:Amt family ammonium transporter